MTGDSQEQNSSSVVVLVHGIRTHGQWMTDIASTLEEQGFHVAATNYGRFDAFRFWLPIPPIRRVAVQHVWKDVRRTLQMHPGSAVSFISHSYGTYIVAKILESEFDFVAHRIIFCGSIVNRRFPFEQVSQRFTSPILNEIGTKDIWPALAKSATWGYGSSGTHGFMRPDVKDRRHPQLAHSDFLTPKFCKEYWIPFLLDGTVTPTNATGTHLPWRVRTCSALPLKYIVLILLLVGLLASTRWAISIGDRATEKYIDDREYSGYARLSSEQGDYIGQGEQYEFSDKNGLFSVRGDLNSISIYFEGDDQWSFEFAAPRGRALEVGRYSSAHFPPGKI